MNNTQSDRVLTFTVSFRNLRTIFIVGFLIEVVLWFVPAGVLETTGFLGLQIQRQVVSALDIVRMLFQLQKEGFGFLYVLFFCAELAFLVLAIFYARRWVFVAGACFVAFLLILDIFTGSSQNFHPYFLSRAVGYLAAAMALTGFWIRPQRTAAL